MWKLKGPGIVKGVSGGLPSGPISAFPFLASPKFQKSSVLDFTSMPPRNKANAS